MHRTYSPPSSTLRLTRRLRRRRHQRGAVFVEATIVISFFILGMLGLMFFREMYVTKLRLARTARASSVAYSMGGCVDNSPASWAKTEIPKKGTASPGKSDEQQQTHEPRPVSGSKEAENIVRDLPGTGTENSVLNPIGSVRLGASVSTQTKKTTPLTKTRGFKQDLKWTSYVTCGDKVRDGDFGEIVNVVTSQFDK